MPSKTIVDFANQIKDYMRGAEVVEGKNHAYSQENNAVIATIENGKSYKVRWTGSATVTLKKNSASGTEVTNGSTSPLSFTADSDFDLYFGSSADVTEIMVYDGASTSDTYEPYYVPVKDRVQDIEGKIPSTASNSNKMATASDITDVYEVMGENGAVNICPFNPYIGTNGGITSTSSGDTLILNNSATTVRWFGISEPITNQATGTLLLKAGTYKLSSPQSSNLGGSKYLAVVDNNGNILATVGGDVSSTFTLAIDTLVCVAVRISANTSLSDFRVQAMLYDARITTTKYQSYAMTNRELTEVKIDNTYASKNIYLTKSGNIKQMICIAATVENIKTVTLQKDFYPINDQDQLYPVLARTTGGIYYFAGLNYVASTHSFNANHPYSPNYGQYRDFLPDTMQVFSTIIWI